MSASCLITEDCPDLFKGLLLDVQVLCQEEDGHGQHGLDGGHAVNEELHTRADDHLVGERQVLIGNPLFALFLHPKVNPEHVVILLGLGVAV